MILAVAAQFLSAVVVLVDKYLVTSPKASLHPVVYAFYVGILSAVVVVLIPFGIVLVPPPEVVISYFIVAFSSIFSTLFLYKSLQLSDASDVAPVMGAVSAIATFAFSFLILHEDLPRSFLLGFAFLVAGTFLISHFRFVRSSISYTLAAGMLFGLSSVFIKLIFRDTTFLNAFFWSRIANVIGALVLIAWPANLKAILNSLKKSPAKAKVTVVGNKVIAGLASLLLLLAISRGSPSLVNALVGIQFIFLFIFAALFAKRLSAYLYENIGPKEALHKFSAIVLVVIGFFFLFLK